MKMTIEQLEKKYEAAKKAEADTLAYIQEQTANIENLKQMEAEAAEAGDLEKYQELKRQRSNMEDIIFVKKASKKGAFNVQDVHDFWAAYTDGYDKELARRDKEIEKAIKALKDAFMGMLQLQNNALETRERCAEFIGRDNLNAHDFHELENKLPMNYTTTPTGLRYNFVQYINGHPLPFVTIHAVPAFLGAIGSITEDDLSRTCRILQEHKPSK